MRLIDAEKLMEDVDKDFCYPEAYKKMIEKQPTAYDLDKVIENLEDYAYSTDICLRHNGCPYGDNEDITCDNCAAIGALEIVKNGGSERVKAGS
ncbi:hypothetical protein [Sporofaciens musculi]|jgi:hypothetical protein|uniref:hypothetical protein n=1 Tax=Sporofaciens musculi TaxID=2681861 RepID=UPI0025A02B3A|nr:hypothetical protein [Sporofaciens musculi]